MNRKLQKGRKEQPQIESIHESTNLPTAEPTNEANEITKDNEPIRKKQMQASVTLDQKMRSHQVTVEKQERKKATMTEIIEEQQKLSESEEETYH